MEHLWEFSWCLDDSDVLILSELVESEQFSESLLILLEKLDEDQKDDSSEESCLADIAYLYHLNGDNQNAAVFYEKAISSYEEDGEFDGSPGFAGVLYEYAIVLNESDNKKKALEYFLKSEGILKKHWVNESDPIMFAELQWAIAETYTKLNEYILASDTYRQAKELLENSGETEGILYIAILNNLGEVLLELKKNDEARELFDTALEKLESDFSSNDEFISMVRNNLDQLEK